MKIFLYKLVNSLLAFEIAFMETGNRIDERKEVGRILQKILIAPLSE